MNAPIEATAGHGGKAQRENRVVTSKTLWTPMIIVQVYLSAVFILFVFGPWAWPVDNKLFLNSYLLIAQLLLFVGYFLSTRGKVTVRVDTSAVPRKSCFKNLGLIRCSLILSFLTLVPEYMSRAGLDTFSVSQALEAFIGGLLNPASQYYQRLSAATQSSTNVPLLALTAAVAPFRWLFVPLCIVNWDRLPRRYKIGSVTFVVLSAASWISIGTNKGIFDSVFVVSFSLLARLHLESISGRGAVRKKASKLVVGVFSVAILALAMMYMTNAITSRSGARRYYNATADVYANLDGPIMSITPDFLSDTVVVVGSYVTQGYYGLSLAMREPFTTTYGFGNSWLLLSLYRKLTGDDSLVLRTYPFKAAKYGWDPYMNWHSIHTWLASDYSFVGTLLVMVLIGYWFGAVWKSVLCQKNAFAVGLFILFMIMFMYFPANNQVFAFIDSFAAFWGLSLLWLFSAKIRV